MVIMATGRDGQAEAKETEQAILSFKDTAHFVSHAPWAGKREGTNTQSEVDGWTLEKNSTILRETGQRSACHHTPVSG